MEGEGSESVRLSVKFVKKKKAGFALWRQKLSETHKHKKDFLIGHGGFLSGSSGALLSIVFREATAEPKRKPLWPVKQSCACVPHKKTGLNKKLYLVKNEIVPLLSTKDDVIL